MRLALAALLLCASGMHAQDKYDGLWQGNVPPLTVVSLPQADAIPAEKYGWRPGTGVRSVSEVIMHIAVANYGLLANTGVRSPADLKPGIETTVTAKAEVIAWLKRSLDTVKTAHLNVKPGDFTRKIKNGDYDSTVDAMYLRIIVHANEHMGQLVAYARMNGIVPPWSK